MLLDCAVGEDSWESLDCKEIKPVNPKGNQSWIFIRKMELKPKLQYFDYLMQTADSSKDPDVGKDWRQKEKGMTEDETIGWHHWLNGQEFEQAPGDGEGQGSWVCCSPWDLKESDVTEWLNWTELNWCRWYHSNGRKWKWTKEPLEESEKAGLKLNFQKTKIMASGPITSWQIEGKTEFIYVGSKITTGKPVNELYPNTK